MDLVDDIFAQTQTGGVWERFLDNHDHFFSTITVDIKSNFLDFQIEISHLILQLASISVAKP